MDIQVEIAISGVLCLLGLALILRGWIGKRIGKEPHCRRCGYDLRGLPEGSARCSECGAILSRPRAIVAGARVRSSVRVYLGAIAVLIGIIPGFHVGRRIAADGWTKLQPAWLLQRQLESSDPLARILADAEFYRRMSANELTEDQMVRIAKWGSRTDLPVKSLPFIVADAAAVARNANQLSDEEFINLWKDNLTPSVIMKKRVRLDHDLFLQVSVRNEFHGYSTWSRVRVSVEDVKVDGRRVDRIRNTAIVEVTANAEKPMRLFHLDGESGNPLSIPSSELRGVSLGRHKLAFVLKSILKIESGMPAQGDATFAVQVEREFEVVAPGEPTVEILKGSEYRARALNGPMVLSGRNGNFLEIKQPQTLGQPILLVCKVLIREGSSEFEVGRFSRGFTGLDIVGALTLKNRPSLLKGDQFDVILQPDPEQAENYPLINEMWGEPIVYKGLKAPATLPSTR